MILHSERLNGVNKLLIDFIHPVANKATTQLNRDVLIIYGYRSNSLQTALYAQGREPLVKVNELRHLAGTYPITEADNKHTVTNSSAGSSPHNYYNAIDIACMKAGSKSEIDWNNLNFWHLVEKEVTAQPLLYWGGWFKSFPDKPHVEVKDWKKLIIK